MIVGILVNVVLILCKIVFKVEGIDVLDLFKMRRIFLVIFIMIVVLVKLVVLDWKEEVMLLIFILFSLKRIVMILVINFIIKN